MIFTEDHIQSCKQCTMALASYNTTGFCSHFCENEYKGVSNKQPTGRVKEREYAPIEEPTPVRIPKPEKVLKVPNEKPQKISPLQQFLNRAKQNWKDEG